METQHTSLIPTLRRQRQANVYELKASRGYKVELYLKTNLIT